MSSVWTTAELDEQIAATKAALLQATTVRSFAETTEAGNVQLQRNSPQELREHLAWLQRTRNRVAAGGIVQRSVTVLDR